MDFDSKGYWSPANQLAIRIPIMYGLPGFPQPDFVPDLKDASMRSSQRSLWNVLLKQITMMRAAAHPQPTALIEQVLTEIVERNVPLEVLEVAQAVRAAHTHQDHRRLKGKLDEMFAAKFLAGKVYDPHHLIELPTDFTAISDSKLAVFRGESGVEVPTRQIAALMFAKRTFSDVVDHGWVKIRGVWHEEHGTPVDFSSEWDPLTLESGTVGWLRLMQITAARRPTGEFILWRCCSYGHERWVERMELIDLKEYALAIASWGIGANTHGAGWITGTRKFVPGK